MFEPTSFLQTSPMSLKNQAGKFKMQEITNTNIYQKILELFLQQIGFLSVQKFVAPI